MAINWQPATCTGKEKIEIGGLIQGKDLALINVLCLGDRQDAVAEVFKTLGTQGINVQLAAQTTCPDGPSLALCVATKDLSTALGVLKANQDRLGIQRLTHHPRVAFFAVHGPHFRERPGLAGLMFGTLAAAGIKMLAVSTSISTLSCVIEAERLEAALPALHETFEIP